MKACVQTRVSEVVYVDSKDLCDEGSVFLKPTWSTFFTMGYKGLPYQCSVGQKGINPCWEANFFYLQICFIFKFNRYKSSTSLDANEWQGLWRGFVELWQRIDRPFQLAQFSSSLGRLLQHKGFGSEKSFTAFITVSCIISLRLLSGCIKALLQIKLLQPMPCSMNY